VVDRINLALDRDLWWALSYKVTNLRVHYKAGGGGGVLTMCVTVSF
jgi:hypothetical protein